MSNEEIKDLPDYHYDQINVMDKRESITFIQLKKGASSLREGPF